MYSRSSFQISYDCTGFFYIGTTDRNWFSVVVFNLGLPAYTEFPFLKNIPLHNFLKWDCLGIQPNTFGIGLLLLISADPS